MKHRSSNNSVYHARLQRYLKGLPRQDRIANSCFTPERAYLPTMPFSELKTLPHHDTLRRITFMRTLAILSELFVMAAARWWLNIRLPESSLFMIVGSLVVWNLWTLRRIRQTTPVNDRELFLQLFVDMAALSGVLYFTGGATNPFVSFYLPALAVSAAILPWRFSISLSTFSLLCYSILTWEYIPLDIQDEDRAVGYHLAGMWANFAVSAALITWFVARMSGALRDRDAQLALAREHQLQNERILALGSQAASAAHEMGTPLATVAVIAHELRNEAQRIPALYSYTQDLATIEAQIAQCTLTLEKMRLQADQASTTAQAPAELQTWLKNFLSQWRLRYPEVRLITHEPPSLHAFLPHAAATESILLTLLDNAAKASAPQETSISLTFKIEQNTALFYIQDEGNGIETALLPQLGHHPVPSTSGGQGIGLMLAFNTARQINANIELSSQLSYGTTAIAAFPITSMDH